MATETTIGGRTYRVEPSSDPHFAAVLIGARGARYGAWTAPELASGRFYVCNLKNGASLMGGWRPVVVEL